MVQQKFSLVALVDCDDFLCKLLFQMVLDCLLKQQLTFLLHLLNSATCLAKQSSLPVCQTFDLRLEFFALLRILTF